MPRLEVTATEPVMIKHHLRELRSLCNYRVVGRGAPSGALTRLVFDADDWRLKFFVVQWDSASREPLAIARERFVSLDDDQRELHLDIGAATAASGQSFRAESLAGSTLFDAVALLGRTIAARNGPAGSIGDFLVNVDLWILRYFVIDTPRRRVLTDIEWASRAARSSEPLGLDLPAEAIASAPAYRELSKLCIGDAEALYRHYTRDTYVRPDDVV